MSTKITNVKLQVIGVLLNKSGLEYPPNAQAYWTEFKAKKAAASAKAQGFLGGTMVSTYFGGVAGGFDPIKEDVSNALMLRLGLPSKPEVKGDDQVDTLALRCYYALQEAK